MLKLTIVFFSILLCFKSFSQSISGTIIDEKKTNIKNAVVALLTPKDSILYKFTRTDNDGKFILHNVQSGNYILLTTHPYFADIIDNLRVGNNDTIINSLTLISKSKLLQEVIIKSGSPIRIKGDTTVYTADSFKVSANANVEELLKKLPGIQVDKSGKITAMGEQVNKVLVDGEEFFGDDPGMAVKNLRADAVKEVQVYDKKSDQAEFTGIDDGNTQKTINLKLKEDRKKGYFGKADAAGGLRENKADRYNTNLMYSSFKGKRKLSGFLIRGNTGQDGLSWEDREKYGGGNDNYSVAVDEEGEMNYTRANNDEEPQINTENGFITNTNAGVQYSNKWNDKKTFNFSPKYNNQLYNNNKYNLMQTNIGDSVLNMNTHTITNVNRSNYKLNASYNIVLDSFNSIKLTAKSAYYTTDSKEASNTSNTGEYGNVKNTSDKTSKLNSDKYSLYGSVLFKHKFKKARRTLSLNTDWNLLNTNSSNYLNADNTVYNNDNISSILLQNQLTKSDKSTQNLSGTITYTEPLSAKYSVQLSYGILYNSGNNNQITNSYSTSTGKYDNFVDSLSNHFKQAITVNTPEARISYNYKKLKYSFGSGVGITNFSLTDISINKNYKRSYTNFFPGGALSYTFKNSGNFKFTYNGSTNQPTIYQLQPIINNNDYFNQYLGNPNLKPSFTHSFYASYNKYDFVTDKWIYQSIDITTTSNAITNSKIINVDSGKTTIQPVNTNGNLSVNIWTGFNFKLKKIDATLFLRPRYYHTKTGEVLNNLKNNINTAGAALGVTLSKFKEKKYEISLDNDFMFNRNKSSQSNLINQYSTNTTSINGTIYYKKTWSLSSDYAFNYRQKITAQGNNNNNQIWNATLKKTFKNEEFTVYIIVKDILNDNIGIDRYYYSNTYTEERNDRLKRYCMLGFTWNFKNKTKTIETK